MVGVWSQSWRSKVVELNVTWALRYHTHAHTHTMQKKGHASAITQRATEHKFSFARQAISLVASSKNKKTV